MKNIMARASIIVIALTLVVLCLTGCSTGGSYNKFDYYKTYEEAIYPVFLNTDWGMSKAEALKALGVKESDAKETGTDTYTVEVKFGGKPLLVELTFGTEVIDEKTASLGLTMAKFNVPDSATLNKVATFENETLFKNEDLIATSVYAVCEKLGIGHEFSGITDDAEYVEYTNVLKTYRIAEVQVNKDESSETLGDVTFLGSALAKIRYLSTNK